ncbi:MAG: DNRLRE domain-containing protein, partial [Candidatus Hadarchaeales archaeon]
IKVLPEFQKQQEATYSSLVKQDFASFAEKISQLTPGKSVTISTPVTVTPTGTQISVDAFFSLPVSINPTLNVHAFNTRQDYLWEVHWSENGLHENIFVGDGYITLDNEWWGNTCITNTHRDVNYEITAYSNLVSFRFVAEKTGTIDNIWFWVYVYTSDYPALKVVYQDNTYDFFYPIEDAQTNSGSSTTNYGTDDSYIIGATTTKAYRAYLKFDLSRLQPQPVQKAYLALSCYDNDYVSSTGAPLRVYSTSDGWNEDTITWGTQPAGITLLSENTITAQYETYYWDVTSYIQSEMGGDNIASLVVMAANEAPTEAKDASFNAMESLWASVWVASDDNYKPGVELTTPTTVRFNRGGVWSSNRNAGWVGVHGLNLSVTKDNIYHFVIQPKGGYQTPNVYKYFVVGFMKPRNARWTDGDPRWSNERAVLYKGIAEGVRSWNDEWNYIDDAEPVFVARYSDGSFGGNP